MALALLLSVFIEIPTGIESLFSLMVFRTSTAERLHNKDFFLVEKIGL